MAPSPCLICGVLVDKGPRCPAHRLRRQTPRRSGLGSAHKLRVDRMIAAWVTRHGWTCPGWQRPPHEVPPGSLVGDHIISRAARPDLETDPQNLQPLCPRCNGKKHQQSGDVRHHVERQEPA
jgi:HNH endonuclease